MMTQKNRPFTFDGMIGQKGIIGEMKKRSKTLDFPEVLILSGPSGTGKTTLAYIIASILNDPNPIINKDGSKSPNLESDSTKQVRNETFNRDIKLYDASSMGKADVLALGEKISKPAMLDKNKIVIIDEAQELTKSGKGVVLELLEKKRKGTYIILCTMDLDSFEGAVKSRGHVYNFRSPNSGIIAEYLFTLTKDFELPETSEIEEFFTKGIFMIAENCEGSIRMAIQNFERCMIGEFYTEVQIEREFSIISKDKLSDLIQKLVNKDPSCIKDIKSFGSKDFFYKALKTLNSTYLYLATGYIDQSWKKQLAERLRGKNIEFVLQKFLEVDSGVYFKEDLFFYNLATILKKAPEIKKATRVRVPRIKLDEQENSKNSFEGIFNAKNV